MRFFLSKDFLISLLVVPGLTAALSLVACSSDEQSSADVGGGMQTTTGSGGQKPPSDVEEDPYLWLEDATSPKALEWVEKTNKPTLDALAKGEPFQSIYDDYYKENTKEPPLRCVPDVDGLVYQFKQDDSNPHGLWRRTKLADCLGQNPSWENLLDLDALANTEKKDWVLSATSCLHTNNDLCLVSLSEGGKDAAEVREFDKKTKSFVNGGFFVPESKATVEWIDANTLFVTYGSDADSLNDSGYPRQVKVWTRGTPLSTAKTVYEGKKTDVFTYGTVLSDVDGSRLKLIGSYTDFFNQELLVLGSDDKAVKLSVPTASEAWGLYHGKIILRISSEWNVGSRKLKAGSLVSIDPKAVDESAAIVYEPDAKSTFLSATTTKNVLLVTVLDNVAAKVLAFTDAGGAWSSTAVPLPPLGAAEVTGDPRMDDAYVEFENFVVPETLFKVNTAGPSYEVTEFFKEPPLFDGSKFDVVQQSAKSKDGTQIPYFVIHSKTMKTEGKNPTLLYGYGGFDVSVTPFYLGLIGKHWLEKGGVYVSANIRGGGEFGPTWHEAATLENKQRSFDDFIAVAEDLVAKKITSPAHLAINGGSNGGLLVGAVAMQRPDLFGAVSCQVPLLDMLRYTKIGAGESWVGEYGDPDDPEMAKILSAYSPYHNIKAKTKYPPILFTTTTTDDRVHPAHARKMAARLQEMQIPFYFYEGEKGGHAGASDPETSSFLSALNTTYLYRVFAAQ